MNRKRLNDILAERANAPATFKADAWKYFEELLPDIEKMIDLEVIAPIEEPVKPTKKEEPPKVEPKSKFDLKPKTHKSR